jgi:hypothetical protein
VRSLFGDCGCVEEELTQVDILRCADLSVQRVTEEQWKEFGVGDVQNMVGEHGRFLVGDGGLLYRVFTETDIRIVVPNTLRSAVLDLVHGSRMVGHWGILEGRQDCGSDSGGPGGMLRLRSKSQIALHVV